MKYYELQINLTAFKTMHYTKMQIALSKFIRSVIFKTSFKNLHDDKNPKPYSFCNLIKDKDKNTKFFIRILDKNLANELLFAFDGYKNSLFQINSVKLAIKHINFIDKIYCLTPVVITFTKDNRVKNWTIYDDGDILYVMNTLENNLINKYNYFFNEKLKIDNKIINFLEITNKKPIKYEYKNGIILANKFDIIFSEDEISQKLAKLSYIVGIGEKNSNGFGYVMRDKK